MACVDPGGGVVTPVFPVVGFYPPVNPTGGGTVYVQPSLEDEVNSTDEGRSAPHLLAQDSEPTLAAQLRDAVAKLQTAADLAAYYGGANDTLPDLEKARSTADGLVDQVEGLEQKMAGPCGSCHPCVNYAHETWVKADRQPPHLFVYEAMVSELKALRAFRDAVEAALPADRSDDV